MLATPVISPYMLAFLQIVRINVSLEEVCIFVLVLLERPGSHQREG